MVSAMNRSARFNWFFFRRLLPLVVFLLLMVEALVPICGTHCLNAQDVDPLKLKYPPTIRKESGTQWTITGNVTSETTGLPVLGGKVAQTRAYRYVPMKEQYQRPLETNETTTNLTGGYSLKVAEGTTVVFTKSGFAPQLVSGISGSIQDVELAPSRIIHGRIVLPGGEPAVGVTVKPVNWLIPVDPSRIYKPSNPSPDQSYSHRYAAFPDFGVSMAVKTDRNGEF